MARMKAKPFINRIPIAPVTALKNGYRLTSPSAAVYDPNAAAAAAVAYSTPPQRFVYTTNGAAMAQAPVPYNNQVHLIVSSFIMNTDNRQNVFYINLILSAIPTAAVLSGHCSNCSLADSNSGCSCCRSYHSSWTKFL